MNQKNQLKLGATGTVKIKPIKTVETLRVRLRHDGVQPGPVVPGEIAFGLQDTAQMVQAGKPMRGGLLQFEAVLSVKPGKDGAPHFSGPFAHGPPAARFLYLSWKRVSATPLPAPWAWRIKMPLADLDWPLIRRAIASGRSIEADVTSRRPHKVEPIAWRLVD